jgi:hypothetical protein
MTFQILELELPVGSGSENSSTANSLNSNIVCDDVFRFFSPILDSNVFPGI